MKKIKPESIIELIIVAFTGIIYILQCSSWTSPLYPYAYGYDASWYSLMGRAITEGKVPYKDYFDLKGPALFFYEAFGQLFIKGRSGIFLIQCISIAITVILVWKTARLFFGRVLSALTLLMYYYIAYALLWGGNTVEELFMPFSMAAVYLTLDFIMNREKCLLPAEVSAGIMGLGFGVFLFSKITVAAVICASTLTVLILLIREKKWEVIKKCAINFLKGIAVVAIPLFIYFIVNGAFKDFIYCSFLFAFKRSTDYYEGFSFEWERSIIICYAALFYGICMKHETDRDKERRLYIIITAVAQFLLLHFGTPYLYYFLCQMPVFVLFTCYFLNDAGSILSSIKDEAPKFVLRMILIAAVGATVIFNYFSLTVDKFKENIMIFEEETGKDQVEGCLEIAALVPEWERDEIYNLESGMIYYEVNQDLPSNRYPVNLPYFLHLDPGIKTDVMNKLKYDTPKWIISERIWDFDDDDVKEFVNENYDLIAENDGEELYRLWENY